MTEGELRELTPADAAAVWEVLRDDGGFSARVEGRAPRRADVDALFEARPPEVEAERKHTLGWFEDGRLVAVADVVEDWPQAGVDYLGLLLVRATHQGRGVGRRFHEAVVTRFGAERWRLSVVASNARGAVPFWQALGYVEVDRRPWQNERGDDGVAIVMER